MSSAFHTRPRAGPALAADAVSFHAVEWPETTSIPKLVLQLRNAAKLPSGGVLRFVPAHSLAREPFCKQGEMSPYLLIEAGVEIAASERAGYPGE